MCCGSPSLTHSASLICPGFLMRRPGLRLSHDRRPQQWSLPLESLRNGLSDQLQRSRFAFKSFRVPLFVNLIMRAGLLLSMVLSVQALRDFIARHETQGHCERKDPKYPAHHCKKHSKIECEDKYICKWVEGNEPGVCKTRDPKYEAEYCQKFLVKVDCDDMYACEWMEGSPPPPGHCQPRNPKYPAEYCQKTSKEECDDLYACHWVE